MSQYVSMVMPCIQGKHSESEVRRMGLDLLDKINSVADSVPGGDVYTTYSLTNGSVVYTSGTTLVLTGNITANRTLTLPTVAAQYTIILLPQASSGGPFALTLQTAASGRASVIVPIVPSADTLLSGYLVMSVQTSAPGDVVATPFFLRASATTGFYVQYSDGRMEHERSIDPGTLAGWAFGNSVLNAYLTLYYASNSYSFPAGFIGDPPKVFVNLNTSDIVVKAVGVSINVTTSAYTVYIERYGAALAAGTTIENMRVISRGTWR